MKKGHANKMAGKAKQVAAVAVAGAMVMGLATAPVYADTIESATPDNNTASADVKLAFKQNDGVKTIYSINVEWGDLEGVYTNAASDEWQPGSHDYKATEEGAYSEFDTGATFNVTVTNHSNAPVKVKPSFQAEGAFDQVKVNFDEQEKTLATAVGTEVANAPKTTFNGTLSGNATNQLVKNTTANKVGTATITVETA